MGKWLSALKWLVVAVVLAVFIGLLIKWNRKGGISVEAGFDDRIELTSQEIRRIEQIGQWEFLSVQSEVVADTLRKGFFTDDRLVAVYTGVPRIGIDMNRVTGEWAQAHGDTVTLRLPAVHLLDKNFIDEARTKVFYESGKWPNGARRDVAPMPDAVEYASGGSQCTQSVHGLVPCFGFPYGGNLFYKITQLNTNSQ